MQLRNLHVGKTFFEQPIPEGLLDVVFAMDDEESLHLLRVLAGKELGEVFVVAVGAHAADAADLGMDFVEDAENVDLLCAGHEPAAQGVRLAIANEEDGIAGVLDVIADMVYDPATVCHAAGGDDDAGFVAIVQELGFVYGFDVFEAPEVERVLVGLEDFLDRLIEVLRVVFHDLGGGNAQGAIDVVVERREPAFFFELIEGEKQFLGAADAEGGDDELAFLLQASLYDPVEDHARGVGDGVVETIAIGRFDQDIVRLWEDFGGTEDIVLIAADVAAEGKVRLFPLFLYLQVNGSAADDMPRVGVEDLDVFVDRMPGIVFDAYEVVHGAFGIVGVV